MRTERSESFKKAYRKLDPTIQKKVDRKLKLFDDRLKQFGSTIAKWLTSKASDCTKIKKIAGGFALTFSTALQGN